MKHLRFLITLTALTAGICLWAQKDMRWSENYGKSIAVFGGSFSIHKESDIAKNYWVEMLHLKLTNYGKGGAGFSNLTQAHNIQPSHAPPKNRNMTSTCCGLQQTTSQKPTAISARQTTTQRPTALTPPNSRPNAAA